MNHFRSKAIYTIWSLNSQKNKENLSELSKMSDFSVLENLCVILADQTNISSVLCFLNESLPDFFQILSSQIHLIYKNFELFTKLERILIKISVLIPFFSELIFMIFQSLITIYNPFDEIFHLKDISQIKNKLESLSILFLTQKNRYITLWDFSKYAEFSNLFLENIDLKPYILLFESILTEKTTENNLISLLIPFYDELEKIHEELYLKRSLFSEKIIEDSLYTYSKKQKTPEKSKSEENIQFIETHELLNEISEIKRLLLGLDNLLIIEGPNFSGKTTLINSVFKEKIIVFLDNTNDLKGLLGNYICSEIIGKFEFKKGPLLQAIEQGIPLIFENLQEANEELLDQICNIINKKNFEIAGREIKVKNGFKIIGISNFKGKNAEDKERKKLFLMNKAEIFTKKPIGKLESETILKRKYEKFYESQLFQKLYKILDDLNNLKNYFLDLENIGKLLKISKRLDFHLKRHYGDSGLGSKPLTEEFRKVFALEIIDIYLSNEKTLLFSSEIHSILSENLNLSVQEIESLIFSDHPQLDISKANIFIGRLGVISRNMFKNIDNTQENISEKSNKIIYTAYSSRLLERIFSCIYFNESCLLIGDTGCGKTTVVQHIATLFNKKLYVYNMNPGSDAIDLIGGFKPLDINILMRNILEKYIREFSKITNINSNIKFIESIQKLFREKQFELLLKCLLDSFPAIINKISKKNDTKTIKKWLKLQLKLENLLASKDRLESNLAFQFIDGNLIEAIKKGDWLLIDEINLANNEVLQKLLPILEGQSLFLYEKGSLKQINRHKNFRIIGCMNPGTDIGKKQLPENIRTKFTELFIPDIEKKTDLLFFVQGKLENKVSETIIENIVDFFIVIRDFARNNFVSNGGKIHISLRNLARTLDYFKQNLEFYGLERTLYDSLSLGLGCSLDKLSLIRFETELLNFFEISFSQYQSFIHRKMVIPSDSINLYGFIIKKGPFYTSSTRNSDFLVTKSFEKGLQDVLRAIISGLPILLEGPTSSGKTSMVKYLASILGYKCVRVNNHEHTDIEEYIGNYQPNLQGKLIFSEGILLKAVKEGYWIILDELNLARSEILESLNRLLDDNKELFINEKQITIKAHSDFRLFATQNPSNYGGRKELSKAFKNRFVQMFFEEINEEELEIILEKRCELAPSFCKKMMGIMKDLKVFRQRNNFFTGKEGVITVRDLLKWGKRPILTIEELALEGYCLLGERLRNENERLFVKETIEKHCKITIDPSKHYLEYFKNKIQGKINEISLKIQWNPSFIRMIVLTYKALLREEPVLLIGETGCGKTTLCQLISEVQKVGFYGINCHKYTESSDFLGALRPVRNHEEFKKDYEEEIETLKISQLINEDEYIILKDNTIAIEVKSKILKKIQKNYNIIEKLIKAESLFEWQDGPLLISMQKGGVFLIDEISLAEDAVLERLNSVLESERTLTISEKNSDSNEIQPIKDFFLIATMNPGGDFGKRELTPALRNRFTEIWTESITSKSYIIYAFEMIKDQLNIVWTDNPEISIKMATKLYNFVCFFNQNFAPKYNLEHKSITMRDIVGIIEFWNVNKNKNYVNSEINENLDYLYLNSLELFVLEPILFLPISEFQKSIFLSEIKTFIKNQISINIENFKISFDFFDNSQENFEKTQLHFSLQPIIIQENLSKIMRALTLNKSILLEGYPGTGKRSLIEYLAFQTKNPIKTITLSENTDLIDLLGTDFPSDSENGFIWKDGILLESLKNGYWLILDDLNLANQTVLEGLNAVLDYRGSIFIPEIGKSFEKNKNFRIFATQAPNILGEGRKGLPSSFLNRFSKIFIGKIKENDFKEILIDIYKEKIDVIEKLIDSLKKIKEIQKEKEYCLSELKRFMEIEEKYGFGNAFYMIFIAHEQILTRKKQLILLLNSIIEYKILEDPLLIEKLAFEDYFILNKHKELFIFAKIAINLGIPIVFSGVSGIGKHVFSSLLCNIYKKKPVFITLNGSIDSNEIFGSYEQSDFELKKSQFANEFQEFLIEILKILEKDNYKIISPILFYIIQKGLQNLELKTIEKIIHIIKENEQILVNYQGKIELFIRNFENLSKKQSFFVFLDSILIKSLRKNDWIIFENTNSANKSLISQIVPLCKEFQSQIFWIWDSKDPINKSLSLNSVEINLDYLIEKNEKNDIYGIENKELEIFHSDLLCLIRGFLPRNNFSKYFANIYCEINQKMNRNKPNLRDFVKIIHKFKIIAKLSEIPIEKCIKNAFLAVFPKENLLVNDILCNSFNNSFEILPWNPLSFNEFLNNFKISVCENEILPILFRNKPLIFNSKQFFEKAIILINEKYHDLHEKSEKHLENQLFSYKLATFHSFSAHLSYFEHLKLKIFKIIENKLKTESLQTSKKLFNFKLFLSSNNFLPDKGRKIEFLMVFLLKNQKFLVSAIDFVLWKVNKLPENELESGKLLWKGLNLMKNMAFSEKMWEIQQKIAFLLGFNGFLFEDLYEIREKLNYLQINSSKSLFSILFEVYFSGSETLFNELIKEIERISFENRKNQVFSIKIYDEYNTNELLSEIPLLNSESSITLWGNQLEKIKDINILIEFLTRRKFISERNVDKLIENIGKIDFLSIFLQKSEDLSIYSPIWDLVIKVKTIKTPIEKLKNHLKTLKIKEILPLNQIKKKVLSIFSQNINYNPLKSSFDILNFLYKRLVIYSYTSSQENYKYDYSPTSFSQLKSKIFSNEYNQKSPLICSFFDKIKDFIVKIDENSEDSNLIPFKTGIFLLDFLKFTKKNAENTIIQANYYIDYKEIKYLELCQWLFAEWKLQKEWRFFIDFSLKEKQNSIIQANLEKNSLDNLKKTSVFRGNSHISLVLDDFYLINTSFESQINPLIDEISLNISEKQIINKEKIEKIRFLINLWVSDTFDRFFLNLQDLLIPLYLSYSLILEGLENYLKQENSVFFGKNPINELEELEIASTNTENLLIFTNVLKFKSKKSLFSKEKLLEIDNFLLRFIEKSLEKQEKPKKTELHPVLDERATKYILSKNRFEKKIIDEYTKEAVQNSRQQKIDEISEFFGVFPKNLQDLESFSLKKVFSYDESLEVLYYILENKSNKSLYNTPKYQIYGNELYWLSKPIISELEMGLIINKLLDKPLNFPIESIDFYNEPNPSVTSCIAIHLENVLERISLILKENIWENNSILQNIAKITSFIREEDLMKASISHIMNMVQLLIEKCMDWDSGVPIAFSLKEKIEPLMGILAEWRRNERKTWKKLLFKTEKIVEMEDIEIFFGLKKILESDNCNNEEIMIILDQFILNCKNGCFEKRMKMLEFLSEKKEIKTSIRKIIKQIFRYYSLFNEIYLYNKNQIIKELEKELAECTELAGWKSKNFLILKETVEKYHRKIHTILRHYKDELDNSFSNFCLQPYKNSLILDSLPNFSQKITEFFGKTEKKQRIHKKSTKILFSNEKDTIIMRAKSLLFDFLPPLPQKYFKKSENSGSSQVFKDFFKSYFERLEMLQKPGITKTMKSRAFLDLGKILKEMNFSGLKQNLLNIGFLYDFEGINLEKMENLFKKNSFSGKIVEKISKIDGYYYKILERLSFLKGNSEFHDDIPKPLIQRGLGQLFEIFGVFRNFYNDFRVLVDFMYEFKEKTLVIPDNIDILNVFPIKSVDFYEKIEVWMDETRYFVVEMEMLVKNFDFLKTYKLFDELHNILIEKIKGKDRIWEFEIINVEYLINKIMNEIILLKDVSQNYEIKGIINVKIKEITFKQTELFNFINNEKQNIIAIMDINDETIKKTQKNVEKIYKNLINYNENLSKYWLESSDISIFDIETQIKSLNSLKIRFPLINSSLNSIKINHLIIESLKLQLIYNEKFLYNFSKFLSILSITLSNIFIKGFCDSEIEFSKNNEEGELEEGTGIGEGEGMENVSKEMEFEQQLQGLKDEKAEKNDKNQEKNDEKQENDDKFDMENDFEGENISDKQENKENSIQDNELEDEFDKVSEELDHDLWKGDEKSEISEEKSEKSEKEREFDDLEFKGDAKKNDLQAKAEKEHKEKNKTRQLSDFNNISEEEDNNEENNQKNPENQSEEEEFIENPNENPNENLEENPKENLDENLKENSNEDSIENSEKKSDFSLEFPEENENQSVFSNENQDNNPINDPLDALESENKENLEPENGSQMDIEEEKIPEEDKIPEEINKEIQNQITNKNTNQPGTSTKEANTVQKNNTNQDNKPDSDGVNQKNEAKTEFSQEFLQKINDFKQKNNNIDSKNFEKNLNVNNEDENNDDLDNNNKEYEVYERDENSKVPEICTNLPAFDENNENKIPEIIEEKKEEKNSENYERNQKIENLETKKSKTKTQENPNNSQNQQENKQNNKSPLFKQLKNEKILKNNEFNMEIEEFESEINDFRLEKREKTEIIKENIGSDYNLWNEIEAKACFYSVSLSENLKSVLEPNEISSFKGDYKSGKRINMKKIIPYIASNFKKDKIWLRRSEPTKRKYQILLAIDNSLSMNEKNVGYFALESLTVLALALSKLEIGEIGVAAIDEGMNVVHNFEKPLTNADCPAIISKFNFQYNDINSSDLSLANFMRESIDLFKEIKKNKGLINQICFVISDGRFNKKIVKPLCLEADENYILYVFIVLDKKDQNDSIYNIKSLDQQYVNGKMQIKMTHYLSDFPFRYYIVVNDVNELTMVLVDILRQYFDYKMKI